jgi:hypothetical protein
MATCFVTSAAAARGFSSPQCSTDLACRSSLSSRVTRSASRVPKTRRHHTVDMAHRPSQSDVSSSEPGNSAGAAASWRDEMRMLLDPGLPFSAKSILVQDMAKRAPALGKEVLEDACATVGLDGVPAVVQQVTDDILPDLIANGPRYASELGRRIPDLAAGAAEAMQRGPSGPLSSGLATPSEFAQAVQQELRNVFSKTPEGLETPSFELVADDRVGYELRRYPAMLVAEADMSIPMDSATTEVEAASAMGKSFNTLATYLFGKNSSGLPMAMTTPVIVDQLSNNSGSMSFIVPSKFSSDRDLVPTPVAPVSGSVSIEERPGAVYAVAEFTGYATAGEVRRQRRKLLDALARDSVDLAEPDASSFSVLIYNGPSTVAFKRRNELCVKVSMDVMAKTSGNGGSDELPIDSFLDLDSVTD